MIAVDTSALIAVVLNEAEADTCVAALKDQDEVLISAGTVAEALIVSARRNVSQAVINIIDGLSFDIVAVTPAAVRRIAQAYQRWEMAYTPPPCISVIASLTSWQKNTTADFSKWRRFLRNRY